MFNQSMTPTTQTETGGGGIPNWEGGSFVPSPGLDLGGQKLYKSPEGPYELYDPTTGEYTVASRDYDELKDLYPIAGSMETQANPAITQSSNISYNLQDNQRSAR